MDDARLWARSTSRWWRSPSDDRADVHRRAGPRRLLALLAVAAGCDEDPINPMAARQPRVQAYGASDFYADGMGMRQPPAGTVPRQRVTGNPGAHHRQGRARDLRQPPSRSRSTRRCCALGQKRYNITCGTCHGPLGDGDSIVARQMALRPPPSLIDYADRPVGYIFEVDHQGLRPDGLLRRRAAGARALGGGGLRAGPAAQPDRHPGQGAAGRARPGSRRRLREHRPLQKFQGGGTWMAKAAAVGVIGFTGIALGRICRRPQGGPVLLPGGLHLLGGRGAGLPDPADDLPRLPGQVDGGASAGRWRPWPPPCRCSCCWPSRSWPSARAHLLLGESRGGRHLHRARAAHRCTHKHSYLNPGFFIVRTVVYFAVAAFIAWRLFGLSTRQDAPAIRR